MKEIRKIVKDAVGGEKIYELLTGKDGLSIPVIDAHVDVPTDWTRVIPALYDLYSSGETIVSSMMQEALRKMLTGSTEDLRITANVLYFQRGHEKEGKSPFVVDASYGDKLRSAIIERKSELEKLRPHGKNGWNAYEDILRLHRNYGEDFGCSFLD